VLERVLERRKRQRSNSGKQGERRTERRLKFKRLLRLKSGV
jgi:hypothetical protein